MEIEDLQIKQLLPQICSLLSRIFVVVVSPILLVVAQPASGSINATKMSTLRPQQLKLKSSITHVEISHASYISSDQRFFKSRNASSSSSIIGMSLEDNTTLRNPCSSAIKGRAFYSLDETQAYINPIWAYFGCALGDYVVEMGRVPHNWSFSDRFWQQGGISPRFVWDRLRPESQGLTGAYFHGSMSKNWDITGFVTPFYVPDMGVTIREEEGRLTSNNPWFRPPPKKISFLGQQLPITASINSPDPKDIVTHAAIGGQLRYRKGAMTASGGVLYKPMNQFVLGTPIVLNSSDEIEIDVTPLVVYHSIAWAEIGMDRWGGEKINLSISHEEPEEIAQRVGWITQNVVAATSLSLYFGKDIVGQGIEATHLYAAYYRLWGGVTADSGEFATSKSYFESRYILRNAIRLGVNQPLYGYLLGRRWKSSLAVTYDMVLHGAMVTSNLDVDWSPSLKVSLIADFIGLTGSGGEDEISNFFASYRSNDKVQLRFSYVY